MRRSWGRWTGSIMSPPGPAAKELIKMPEFTTTGARAIFAGLWITAQWPALRYAACTDRAIT
jgi:hypothetical protein